MSEFAHLGFDVDASGVARVTLDRPPVNALDLELIGELAQVAARLAGDEGIRVAVVSSARPGFFCAGADLAMVDANWHRMMHINESLRGAFSAWERLAVPTIAVLDGHALGGGFEFALTCDFRVMSRGKSRVGLPETLRGLLPAAGGTQRLGRLLGRARTLDLVLRGRLLDADEAERLGLVTMACEPEDMAPAVDKLAAEFLALAPLTLAAIKEAILNGLDTDFASGLTIESYAMARVATSEDAREGLRSFLEKRPPKFVGR